MTLYRTSGGPLLKTSGGGLVKASSGGGGKTVIQSSNFTYLGYYDVNLGGEFCYGQGLTHRYVGGELRFLALTHAGSSPAFRLVEFAAPASLSGTVSATTRTWSDPFDNKFGNPAGHQMGIWWDEAGQRLWTCGAIDYPTTYEQEQRTVMMTVTTLGSTSDSVTLVRGKFGFDGHGARKFPGGVVPVPAWFQTQYGTGPYATGFGGYVSRILQGRLPSMGPVLYAFDDPVAASVADEGNLTASQFDRLMDCESGTDQSAWYPAGSVPTTFDRGWRTDDVTNNNGGAEGTWTSPAPDGYGRWIWGDCAYSTGCWIDLPTKHGFVMCPTVTTGLNQYDVSQIKADGTLPEFQFFNPDHFGEVMASTREPWDVRPTEIWRPAWVASYGVNPPNTYGNVGRDTPLNTLGALTFDATTNRLYGRWNFAGGTWPSTTDRIFVWEIA